MNSPASIVAIIDGVIRTEGDYSDNPNDKGGKTRWGITEVVARAHGYTGDMKDLPQSFAYTIYASSYVTGPWFDRIAALEATLDPSTPVAAELVDCGVNSGPPVAALFLQRILNVMNNQGAIYQDIVADGHLGPGTLTAFSAFMKARGAEGLGVLLKALHCLRGQRFIDVAEKDRKDETFVYGWLLNRV